MYIEFIPVFPKLAVGASLRDCDKIPGWGGGLWSDEIKSQFWCQIQKNNSLIPFSYHYREIIIILLYF
jgi:hypothetical protein